MKKLILISAMILLAGIAYAQSLQKGNLVGTHVITVSLKQGVTIEQYIEYFKTKVIPQMEMNMPNWKAYVVKGIRGENNNCFGMIIVIKSAQDRDKYYNADGTDNELGKSVNVKLKSTLDELEKLGTYTSKYTDWIVQ